MENASKALIIAGAILISIVLVSVGVVVVNSLNTDTATTEMSQQEVQSFNSKFESNVGNSKQGSVARSLISTVITNNTSYIDDPSCQITIETEGISGAADKYEAGSEDNSTALASLKNLINASGRYNITIEGYQTDGRIKTIKITKK